MIGKGQDKQLIEGGLTGREMNWFKTCGRGLNGEFPTTVLVDTKKMKISTGHELDETNTVPLRGLLFAMDVIVKNKLEDIKFQFAEKNEKCGSHHCNRCDKCVPFEPEEPTMCIFDDFKECTGCMQC